MRVRIAGIVGTLAMLVLAPAVAQADEDPPAPAADPRGAGAAASGATVTESTTTTIDVVHLRGGGLFRGRVTEIVPGDHVSILLPSAETKRVPWSSVERVIVASTAVPPLPNGASEGPPPMAGPLARVHIKSSGKTTLYRRPAGRTDFVAACESPCDTELPLGDTYKIGGSGITTTSDFRLQANQGGSVDIDVSGPNWFGIIGGGTMILGGAGTAYAGLLFALAGESCQQYHDCNDLQTAGFVALGVGGALIAVGMFIVFPSMKTDISQSSGSSKDAFVRTPTWRTAGTSAGPAAPTFPFFYEARF